jgi:predicted nucleic-acid-binding Zn-ribbon protein
MRRGLCPKCQTPTVYRRAGGISYGGGSSGKVFVHTSWITSGSPVENFICSRCGYFESYVIDEKKMAEITSAWEKVSGDGGGKV